MTLSNLQKYALQDQKCFKIITNLQRAKLRKKLVNIGQQIAYVLCAAQCTRK